MEKVLIISPCVMSLQSYAMKAWKSMFALPGKKATPNDTLMKLGAGYGAGMGCMQATCGALIGAVMAAGSVTDGKGTPRTARSILTSFQEKSGATICKDLKGVETGKVLCPCAQCVRNAVLAAGEMLGE